MNLKALIPYYQDSEQKETYELAFTVFTPVYNRAETIYRVFESLESQTYKNLFEDILTQGLYQLNLNIGLNQGASNVRHQLLHLLRRRSTLFVQTSQRITNLTS